jgi:hypothetical protein
MRGCKPITPLLSTLSCGASLKHHFFSILDEQPDHRMPNESLDRSHNAPVTALADQAQAQAPRQPRCGGQLNRYVTIGANVADLGVDEKLSQF